jgi:very-short-patch-repair endonuclease
MYHISNRKKKWFRQNRSSAALKLVCDELIVKMRKECKFKDVNYRRSVFSRHGMFLVSHENKVVVKILGDKNKDDAKLRERVNKKGYRLFFFVLKDNNKDALINEIVTYKDTYEQFIERRAGELEKMLPKSEQWFRKKFEKEFFYDLLNPQYNAPFKNYIYDVLIKKYNIVIEVDSSIHNKESTKIRDERKDLDAATYGFIMIRIKAYNEYSYKDGMKRLHARIKQVHQGDVTPQVILKKAVDNIS